MHMSQHTPGPWKVFRGKNIADDMGLSISDTQGLAPIARIPPDYAHGPANAALIAAAPDLLAGARAMLAAIDALLLLAQQHDPATGCCSFIRKSVDPYEITRLLQTGAICIDARAAIAKAEGGLGA